METTSSIAVCLILVGACIMALSLVRSLKTQWLLKEFASREAMVLRRFNLLHQVLMMFFLLGYFAVAWSIWTKTVVVSEPFVGVIFFFGAIFVLLGTHLQSTMNGMISRRYSEVREAKQKLEQEQAQLLELNAKLSSEIEERQRAEALIKESEARLQLILESLPMGVLIIDAETLRIHEVNEMAVDMIGAAREEIIGNQCSTIMASADGLTCPMRHSNRPMDKAERLLITRAGEELPILKTVCRITLEGRQHYLEAFLDISEKKALEKELQRSQKMEMLGTLAGGVAHDLNNILSGLVSYPELLLLDLEPDNPKRKPLETIRRSGKKAATIVQDLLTLARRGAAVHKVIDLERVVADYLHSPEHERLRALHPDVRFDLQNEDSLLPIEGSSVHLGKTVMNLVTNAAEALPKGGHVQLFLENIYVDQPIHGYETIGEGDYVVLTVIDDGIGIPPEDLEKIFEPFYSSKVMGNSGSGLGMAVVWSTVKDHRGYIEIDSMPGKGTMFRLYFPVTRKRLDPLEELQVVAHGGGEKILVVDDVSDQLEIAGSILERLGYRVTTAMSGEEAVACLTENRFDLVLLDMIMVPGIDGLETYRRISELSPGQRTVLASGYAEPERVQAILDLGVSAYIKKPYTLATLGKTIHRALDGAA